jgi:endonuclease YncB( thermonuclease family)
MINILHFFTWTRLFRGRKTYNIEPHPFIPEVIYGKVINVCDGNTITVDMRDFSTYILPVCLLGVNSPGIDVVSVHDIALAKRARDRLSALILDKDVKLLNISVEKYGRLSASVYIDNIHVNQWMVENKYAISCDGCRKSRNIKRDPLKIEIDYY